jgi:hypothetical protein
MKLSNILSLPLTFLFPSLKDLSSCCVKLIMSKLCVDTRFVLIDSIDPDYVILIDLIVILIVFIFLI